MVNVFEKVGKVIDDGIDTAVGGAKKIGKALAGAVGDSAGEVREEGLSGAEIHRLFTEGGGATSLWNAAGAWRAAGERYDDALDELTAAVRAVWPDWEGAAATAARGAMAPFERSLTSARDAAVRMSTVIETQARWFELTRRKVHKLADEPPFDPGPATAALLPDMEKKADAYHEKADANRQFYREYIDATRQNVAGVPEFTPPPALASPVVAAPASPAARIPGTATVSSATGASGASAAPPRALPTDITTAATRQPVPTPQPGGPAPTATAVRPASIAGTTTRPAAAQPVDGTGRSGERGGSGAGWRSGGFGAGRGAQSGTVGRAPGGPAVTARSLTPAAVATQPPLGPPAFGPAAKRDEEESHRSGLPGPDKWQLFGLDEEPPPAVIGLWRERR